MNRSYEQEMMDLPHPCPFLLEQDLRNLRVLNRYLGGCRTVMTGVRAAVRQEKLSSLSLLDIGTGSADVPAAIHAWARRERLQIRIVGLEANAVTAKIAASRTSAFPEIAIVGGDGAAPPFPPRSFDFVLASQFLHHFIESEIVALLRLWSRIARRGLILCDLVRHPAAYYGIRLLTRIATRNLMTLKDAPLSVQRALTLSEWRDLFAEAAIGPFRIIPVFPFRFVALVFLAH